MAQRSQSIVDPDGLTVKDARDFLKDLPASAVLHASVSIGSRLRKLELRADEAAKADDASPASASAGSSAPPKT